MPYTSPLYTYTIGYLAPGASQTITISGILKSLLSIGTLFGHKIQALTPDVQYTTGNDTSLLTGQVAMADLSILTGSFTGAQPEMSGDQVNFLLTWKNT